MKLKIRQNSTFQDRLVPANTKLAGWSALVCALEVKAPVRRPSCVSEMHLKGSRKYEADWEIFDKRYYPGDTFAEHLAFALKNEPIDLLLLKRIFDKVSKSVIAEMVSEAPQGGISRRAWYFYELLRGQRLDLPDAPSIAAIDLLDSEEYFTGQPQLSKRHRVRDNLLGNVGFCPIIRRTKKLAEFTSLQLAEQAKTIVGRTGPHLVARAASFLLLADSRASFQIEGERPPRNRLERWGRAVLQAGRNELTLAEIIRLHGILIEDTRFVGVGLRSDGVFLGQHESSGEPLPEFIGARPNDLADLMKGILKANDRMRDDGIDPVFQAAVLAFGFVYIHPFQDGNGRMHRCLIHHVLTERKFTPPGLVFPVSSVMFDRIDEYRKTLQAHSGPLMDFIEWRPTAKRNVDVLNETADLYRYVDCTEAAEFLYECVQRTVEQDLPREIDFLRRHDEAIQRIMNAVEMPDRKAEALLMFIRQNKGRLSVNRRKREFDKLTDGEVVQIEAVIADAFEGFEA
ncbi:Fic family protein [Bdellovibrionota bacterium FG-2]